VAAQKKPSSQSEVWLRNATTFFRELLSKANDGVAKQIASALQGFEAGSADFFAGLVGLDERVSLFWDEQKRAQARARLLAVSAARITPEAVHSWAVICAADGLQEADRELLRQKFGYIAKYLVGEKSFLKERRTELLQLLQSTLLEGATSVQAAIALNHLVGSDLFSEASEYAQIVVETLIERFGRDDRYRGILQEMPQWTSALLKTFLEQTELFLAECSDENPDDVLILFDAAREVCRRAPHQIPDAFSIAVNRLLKKQTLHEWADAASSSGRVFHTQLSLLIQQNKAALPAIEEALIVKFELAPDGEGMAEPDGGKK
jgi:hypothetical protein